MNASERDQLQQFLNALRQTRAEPKDPTADSLIREAVQAQADAPYLLVQRAMGLGLALEAAQARIQQLEAQCAEQAARLLNAPTAAPATPSFWMSGTQSWGRGAEPAAAPATAPVAQQQGAVQHRVAASGAAPQASAWGGGLMAQVATTAAGVVAGGLLFQGVQSLMGHHSQSPSPASPLSAAPEEALPGLVSPQTPPADLADAGDASWGEGEDWA